MKILIREISHKNKFRLSLDTKKVILGFGSKAKWKTCIWAKTKKNKKTWKTCTDENKILNFKLQKF